MVAAVAGHHGVVRLLCGLGGSGNAAAELQLAAADTANERTLLHHTAQQGNAELAASLIEACPELINKTDKYSHAPIIYALQHGHVSAVKKLIPTSQEWKDLKIPGIGKGAVHLEWSEKPVTRKAAKNKGMKVSNISLIAGLAVDRVELRELGEQGCTDEDWRDLVEAGLVAPSSNYNNSRRHRVQFF